MPQKFQLGISEWTAWAPGLVNKDDWHQWSLGNKAMLAEGKPKVEFLDPSFRRRISYHSKMALQVAHDCMELAGKRHLPCIFASRHAEIHRTVELLEQLIEGEEISPTGFGLSVHNSSSGLYSIATQNKMRSTAIAAGIHTFLSALVEAYAQLCQGPEEEVLLVVSDQKIPQHYSVFSDEIENDYAFACILNHNQSSMTVESLSGEAMDDPKSVREAQALQFLRWLMGSDKELLLSAKSMQWVISR